MNAPAPMTFWEWQAFAQAIHARAERVSRSLIEDARRTCTAAGLDGSLLGIHPHNAMCAYRDGRPWRGVNYSLVRRTLWLIERSYEPTRIAERIIRRAWARVTL